MALLFEADCRDCGRLIQLSLPNTEGYGNTVGIHVWCGGCRASNWAKAERSKDGVRNGDDCDWFVGSVQSLEPAKGPEDGQIGVCPWVSRPPVVPDGGRVEDAENAPQIGHFFADVGVECEPLSAYGEVWRYGIDPDDSPHTDHLIEIDLRDNPPVPEGGFDLGLFHPPCYEWTQRSDESSENLIPRSRELAEKHCKEWIIENQPGAPLSAPEGGSLVTLHGSQFGLPVVYERQFETSYDVPEPPRNQHWSAEHRVECTRPKRYWQAVKGYTGDYPRQTLITNALPAPYVHWLVRPTLQGYAHRKAVQSSLEDVVAADGGAYE